MYRWDSLPKNKKELIQQFDQNKTIQWPTPYYVNIQIIVDM